MRGSPRRPAGAEEGQLSLAAEEGEAAGDPAVDARLAGELAERQRERVVEFGVEQLLNEVEMPLIEVLARDGADRAEARHRAARRDRRRDGGADRRARGADLRGRRPRVHDRLAAAARDGVLRRARADQEAPRQDRLLDRRPGPRPASRRASDRRAGRALARADQAQEHLPRLAPDPGRRELAHPHDLQPGDRGDRAAVEHQPEPAEHPDPLRCRAPGARLLRRRAGQAPAVLRLQPGRASGARPRRGRGRPARDLRLGRGRALGDRGRDHRRRPRRDHAGGALEGEDGQLRDRLRALGFRACRPAQYLARGGGHLHRPLLRAVPRGEAVHRRDDRRCRGGGVRPDADRPPAQHPRAALGQPPAARRSASGWRSTP